MRIHPFWLTLALLLASSILSAPALAAGECEANEVHTQPPGHDLGCWDDCSKGNSCEGGFECKSFNGDQIQICLPGKDAKKASSQTKRSKGAKGSKVESASLSNQELRKRLVGKGFFAAGHNDDPKQETKECIKGVSCYAYYIRLRKGGGAQVSVLWSPKLGSTPARHHQIEATWRFHPEGGMVLVEMCDEAAKTLGVSRFHVMGTTNGLVAATQPSRMSALIPASHATVLESVPAHSPGLCGFKPAPKPVAAKPKTNALAKKLVGKGYFSGVHAVPLTSRKTKKCRYNKPCYSYYIKLFASGEAIIRIVGTSKRGNTEVYYMEGGYSRARSPIVNFNIVGSWRASKSGTIAIDMCPAARALRKKQMTDLEISVHKGKPTLVTGYGASVSLESISEGIVEGKRFKGSWYCR